MATKAERERFDQLAGMGCIVCRLYKGVYTQTLIHHLTGLKYRATGKKADYRDTIPLCPNHHQYGTDADPSVHSHPKAFEESFGSQESLLEITNGLIKTLH